MLEKKFTAFTAFTLAEVLITLGIIGVVAAFTIPTLMASYQKQEYVTGLKKAYSQMNQVLLQMAVDNGTYGSIDDYFDSDITKTGDSIASYYKVAKNCKTNVRQGCVAEFNVNVDGSGSVTYNWDNANYIYKFVTADGITFAIFSYGNNCTENKGFSAAPDSPTYNSACAFVSIDINGLKKPNNLGRDVFEFYITSKKTPLIYPSGGFYCSGTNEGTLTGGAREYWNYMGWSMCNGKSQVYGASCAGRVMEKGWVMDY